MTTRSAVRRRRAAFVLVSLACALQAGAQEPPLPGAPQPSAAGKSHDKLPPALAVGLIAYEDAGVIKVIDLAADATTSFDLPERMEQPAWNPDGKRFTYSSSFGVSILDIPNQTFMSASQPGQPAGRPSWSGDGTRLVYEVRGDDPRLEVFDTRDKSRRPLALTLRASQPSWHPKLDRLAFVAAVDGVDQVFVADAPCLADATCDKPAKALQPVQVTKGGKANREPAWSPDGARLAFERDAGDDQGTGVFVMPVAVMPPAGGAPQRLSPAGSDDHAPSWGSNDALAFQRGSGEKASVCVMKADGGGVQTVIKDAGRSPSWWRPAQP
jgi:Tol biopolymer transport system component